MPIVVPVNNVVQEINKEIYSPQNININAFKSTDLELTPFQMIFDKTVDALQSISNMEFRVNNLMEEYMQGKGSVDEVMIATAEFNLAVTAATTIINNGINVFKELQNLGI
ncbi:hypothetical protein HOC37_01630 [bacterium]|jgi:flagellar hook-basal body complex protein FliE|nr:hypothetical protein [bacterium]MBT3581709.1 hypothetical protein [bacterium]MBT4551667.1 hypothetical protein [bacterium]MBT7087407.1 hypothetical protein [bacterium]